MPLNAFCEAPFPPDGRRFRHGDKVYTEDAGGSSPSSPTIIPKVSQLFYEVPAGFVEPANHFCYGKNGSRGRANAVPDPNQNQPFTEVGMATPSPIITALFWSKVRIPDSRVDCWEWSATRNSNGYGRMMANGRWIPAHRFSYEQLKGPIPDGLQVRHLCHNRLCCNPQHLDVGTAKENAQDSLDAGRFVRGSASGNAKLNDDQVIYIRQNPERLRTKDLAEKFSVSAGTISNIRTGKIWRHVPEGR